jgi:DNA-binding HxlR family transcriptional regulator
VDVIEGKWKPIILFALKGGPLRFGELRRAVPEAAQKVLTEQLREMEADGVLARKIKPGRTPAVQYSLTSYGKTLMPILRAMAEWGQRHRSVVLYRGQEMESLKCSVDGTDEDRAVVGKVVGIGRVGSRKRLVP